jgi:acetyl-CoA carboxylase biotin carboxyl carrier protein
MGWIDGRRFAPELAVLAKRAADEGERRVLAAPMPGFFRGAPPVGALVYEGGMLGELEVLGVRHRLIVPAGVRGVIVAAGEGRRLGRRPVGFGEALAVVDPSAIVGAAAGASDTTTEVRASAGGDLIFRAPMGGRYYARPSPDAEPFVRVGEVIEAGRPVALLEVMKTFHRVQYGGAAMPARARVIAVVPKDGDDIHAGDPLLELELA